jgi:hypothetical protein
MVACLPSNPAGFPYGAGRKDRWPGEADIQFLVSPLTPTCETRFRYGKFGTVFPARKDDVAAEETIKHLGLDHDFLVGERKAVIQADLKTRDDAKRRKLVRLLEDRKKPRAERYAFQRAQALRREWSGLV